jgi:hypothetical protein
VLPFASPVLGLVQQVRAEESSVSEYEVDFGSARFGARPVDVQVAPVLDAPGHVMICIQQVEATIVFIPIYTSIKIQVHQIKHEARVSGCHEFLSADEVILVYVEEVEACFVLWLRQLPVSIFVKYFEA